MSSQRGNSERSRAQKHKNKVAFKNNLHDTSNRTKQINTIQVSDVCVRCKEIIEWKIKYKKYKPLTQPRTCVRCNAKTVKQAYHVMCVACGRNLKLCTKCCQPKEVVVAAASDNKHDQLKLDNEMKNLLETLPERKRRTFMRYLARNQDQRAGGGDGDDQSDDQQRLATAADIMAKFSELKVMNEEDSDDEDDGEDKYEDSDFD